MIFIRAIKTALKINFYTPLALLFFLVFICGCGKNSWLEHLEETFPSKQTAAEAQVSIYWDATPSMEGYTAYKGNYPYTQLPKILYNTADRGSKPDFYRFGTQAKKINSSTPYLDVLNSAFYSEPKNQMGAVIDGAEGEHLAIIVSDLFEDKEDWVPIVSKVRNKYLSQGKAALVIGFKNPFKGRIYDIGASSNAPSMRYNSGNAEEKFRPFYILILGNYTDAERFRARLERESKENGWLMETVFFTKELSVPLATLADGEITENNGISEMGNLANRNIIGELARDFRINDSGKGSLTTRVKYKPLLGGPSLEGDYFCEIAVKKSAPDGSWKESRESAKLVTCEGLKVDTAIELTLATAPAFGQIIEVENAYMFVDIVIRPKEETLKLPYWVDKWNAGSGSGYAFEGAKTLNLKALLTELKDASEQTQKPQLAHIMAVFAPRNGNAKLKSESSPTSAADTK